MRLRKMKKWTLIHRSGVGAFGYEVYKNNENVERFLVKVFVYDKPILLSGNREILGNKLQELAETLKELQKMFPPPKEPPF